MASRRVKLWHESGGDPIIVMEVDAERLMQRGWSDTDPAKAKKSTSKDQAAAPSGKE